MSKNTTRQRERTVPALPLKREGQRQGQYLPDEPSGFRGQISPCEAINISRSVATDFVMEMKKW